MGPTNYGNDRKNPRQFSLQSERDFIRQRER